MHHAHSDHMHTHAQSFRARCNHCTRRARSSGTRLESTYTSSDQRWVISVAREGYGRAIYAHIHTHRRPRAGLPRIGTVHSGAARDRFEQLASQMPTLTSQEGTSIRLEGKIIALAPALDSWSVKHKGGEVGRGRIGPGLEDARNALQAPSFACTLASAKWLPAYLVIERSGPGLASTRHAPPT